MIVTRFAPSPTGEPHIGNIRTALFAWAYARSQNGRFFLRIEDTDKAREVEGAVDAVLESLEWLGIHFDKINEEKKIIQNEEPQEKYEGIVFQSRRIGIYKKHAEILLKKGHAYICACSPERLLKLREDQAKSRKPTMYDGFCREKNLSIPHDGAYVIRMKMPCEGATKFNDIIRGSVSFENKLIDDQILLKSDGFPTYHLANVVDDYAMDITHVIRGEDWLSSTPKHIVLYRFFGWDLPQFAHLPMILGKDKSKLSKRHGAVSVLEYKRQGYAGDAFFNYLALLGWNPGDNREFFSDEDFIKEFTLERVQKSPAIFDLEKLQWMSGVCLRKLSVRATWKLLKSYLDEKELSSFTNYKVASPEKQIELFQERARIITDFIRLRYFLVELPEYDARLLLFKKAQKNDVCKILALSLELLQAIKDEEFNKERLKHYFNQFIAQHGFTVGEVLHPVRVSITGLKDSPGPFETMEVLGKKETIRRIKLALQK
ncbi:MAG: glutamate--tRNA ligase [Candidatus Jacksonbacteria bacterium]|nr:glutamate--tRNA ligase [Candidatus Jacksonbacteria bacterium]